MSNELERVHAHNFSDIWSFVRCFTLFMIIVFRILAWAVLVFLVCLMVGVVLFSLLQFPHLCGIHSCRGCHHLWQDAIRFVLISLFQRSSETPSEASERRTDSGSSDRIHPEDDDFDLHEIEQAIRESQVAVNDQSTFLPTFQCDDAWQLAGITKEKKSQKPPLPPCTKKPVQPQEAKRKAQSKRVKVPSESSIPSRRSSDDRKGAKNVVQVSGCSFIWSLALLSLLPSSESGIRSNLVLLVAIMTDVGRIKRKIEERSLEFISRFKM